ncbi:MAG: transporter substrate-binding domain-containing protein [Anaerolineales bacterium]|nr:transporter substrate-binding domain-containing protein [Anaerolineales bacterium]
MKPLSLKVFPMLVIISMFLASCNVPTGESLPYTPTPIIAVSATSAVPASDDVWDRIMLNKKIVVGMSWDYPPFSSVDPAFQVVGLDIALIEEVGRRLQIPIEIQNYAFEGLPGALQLNQIDLAVAAMAITPERMSQMSFSPIYYVNQTAILANNDSAITSITDFNQLAGLRVGVRRGTTYEKMVQNLLIDTGLMSQDKLLSYMQTDESVRDLIANRVDVVLLGEATANYYGSQQNLRVVGTGFHEQDLAIAMRLDTPQLKAEIDRVMDEMLTDGTVLGLIQQYIQSDVSGALSTPIPAATLIFPLPVVAAPLACVDGMKFVADVTYGDSNMKSPPFVKPGEAFVKTWRVQNTGTCTWTPNYRLVYAYGNVTAAQMGGLPLNIPANVTPGQTIDLSIPLTAPTDPLTYQGFWQVQNEKGSLFGQAIWVAISTSTVAVQNTAVATVQSSDGSCLVITTAPKNSITVNSSFDTIWTVQNKSGEDWSSDSVDYKFVSGTKLQKTDVYDLAQTIKNGESGTITVHMLASDNPGVYSTTWALVADSRTLCTLTMSVTVKAK